MVLCSIVVCIPNIVMSEWTSYYCIRCSLMDNKGWWCLLSRRNIFSV